MPKLQRAKLVMNNDDPENPHLELNHLDEDCVALECGPGHC